jgi:hypothetical protein
MAAGDTAATRGGEAGLRGVSTVLIVSGRGALAAAAGRSSVAGGSSCGSGAGGNASGDASSGGNVFAGA